MSAISIIVPTYNESEFIASTLRRIRDTSNSVEIVVCDGGSQDHTREIAQRFDAVGCQSKLGRGVQCNVGAAHAHGEILLFLHADTLLPADWLSEVSEYFGRRDSNVATFRLRFDNSSLLLNFFSYLTRFESRFTTFGDQCICVRRAFFKLMGGFKSWPLFEDVSFLRDCRLRADIHKFSGSVETSARRFTSGGILFTQVKNAALLLAFTAGVSPHRLARYYSADALPRDP